MVTSPPGSACSLSTSRGIEHTAIQRIQSQMRRCGARLAAVVAVLVIAMTAAAAADTAVSQSADSGTTDSAVTATSFSTDASENSLAEVTVTARRRTELAQDVPISMTVVKGRELQDLATNSPLD